MYKRKSLIEYILLLLYYITVFFFFVILIKKIDAKSAPSKRDSFSL